MSKRDDIKAAFAKSTELADLLKEATDALLEYVRVGQPIWQAEEARIRADAAANGTNGGIPFRAETLIAKSASSPVLEAFLLAGVEYGGSGTSHQELVKAIKNIRDEYRNDCKKLAPAP